MLLNLSVKYPVDAFAVIIRMLNAVSYSFIFVCRPLMLVYVCTCTAPAAFGIRWHSALKWHCTLGQW